MDRVIERRGGVSAPMVESFPRVIAGVCEFCGVLDSYRSDVFQYQLCPHFGGQELMCSYCPDTVNPEEIVRTANMKVHGHPDNPNKLVVVCDSLKCSDKHLERFKINN